MEIRRFFATVDKLNNNEIIIDGSEFLHLSKVLRLKKEYKVIISLNNGFDYHGKIENILQDYAIIRVEEIVPSASETINNIVLFQSLPKKDHLEVIIQKSVELGVKKICIFKSKYSQNYDLNIQRLKTIIKDASKQSGRNHLMEIEVFDSINSLATEINKLEKTILFYELEKDKNINLLENLKDRKSLGIVIGSEGGFSEEEVQYFSDNYKTDILTLGKRILRCETAAIVALTLTLNILGELE